MAAEKGESGDDISDDFCLWTIKKLYQTRGVSQTTHLG